MTNDIWITKHIQAIATDAVVYQKKNLHDHIDRHINSKPIKHLIIDLVRTACNRYAAAALHSFANTVKPDDNNKDNNNTKEEDEGKIIFGKGIV